jgi:hypothetical protein
MDSSKILEHNQEVIDSLVLLSCRKQNIAGELSRDFGAYVYEKLLENDGKRLKDYQGSPGKQWRSYLSVVITRLAIDFTKKQWGRWDNSAIARRLGVAAMKFEILLYRNRYPFSEASQIMMELPDYSVMHRLFTSELSILREKLPKLLINQLESHSKEMIYLKNDFQIRLDEILKAKNHRYIPLIIRFTKIRMEMSLLEDWELQFQDRLSSRKFGPIYTETANSRDHLGDEVLDCTEDKSVTGPLSLLLNDEMLSNLDCFVEGLVSGLDARDWTILSLYLLDNLKVSEITRLIYGSKSGFSKLKPGNKAAATRKWKSVNKRISSFMKKLRKQIEPMAFEKEEMEIVSRLCFKLIAKKMEKNG